MQEPSRNATLLESDVLFGRLVVEQGLAKQEHVDECLHTLKELSGQRVSPLPKLGELLVRKGYLSSIQYEATVRISDASKPSTRGDEPVSAVPDVLPPAVAEAARDPANLIGKYVKVTRLGVGGMSEVWGAWDRELGRWLALKFMKGTDPVEFARFKREAQTAGKLAHPNIAAIYEVGDDQGKPFIAMQCVEGMTLATYPRDDVRLVVNIIRDAALAVQYAHESGIIHRDLKPANIMVATGSTRRASGRHTKPHVYVMDFGLAKGTDVDVSLSQSGSVVGTPTYMSPEQARAVTDLDARTDVYSLGATLYELLTLRQPFQDSNVYGLLKKVVEEDPVAVRKIQPRVSADLETVVMKCLEKDRRLRYASALELAEDLGRWLDGEAILAHPPSLVYRLRKTLAKRKALTAVVAVALLAAAGFSVYRAVWVRRAHDWVAEARTLYEGGKYPEAKQRLDQARAFVDVDPELYRRIEGRLREDVAISEAKRREDEVFGGIFNEVDRLLRAGEALVQEETPARKERRYRLALKILDEGLGRFDGSWKAWLLKAQLHEKIDKLEVADELGPALDAYGRAYKINPILKADAAVSRGASLHIEGKTAEAILEFTAALEIEPNHFDALVQRGAARRARGDLDGALEDYSRALKGSPPSRRKEVEDALGELKR